MQVLTEKEIDDVGGSWAFLPVFHTLATCLGIFVAGSNVPLAAKRYNEMGHDIGERAYNATHSDADILGQMTFTADDFKPS